MGVPELYRGNGFNTNIIDVPGTAAPVDADRLDFRALITTFNRRIWLFAAVAWLVFCSITFLTLTTTPVYTATARVLLETRRPSVTPGAEQQARQAANPDTASIETEVELIQSRTLAASVVDALQLDKDPVFNPALRREIVPTGWFETFKAAVKKQLNRAAPPAAPMTAARLARQRDTVIDVVLSGLEARRVEPTFAIDIRYTSIDPERSAAVANEFARQYTRSQLDLKAKENREITTLLSGRMEELRQQAQRDTAAVQQYRIANNLLSTSGASLTEQEISAYNQAVATARASAAEDQARLNTARAQLRSGSTGDDVGEALGSGVISSLRSQRAAISGRVADLSGRYGPRHPDMLKAERELADVDQQIQAEINRIVSNLEAKAQVSRERLQSLQGSLSGARGTLQQNSRASVRLAELEQRASTSQALYESYLERLKQTAAEEGTQRADARIISNARLPRSPSAPNIPLGIMLGLVLGLGAGVAAAFLAEMMSSSLTTAEEVEQRFGLPYLGGVPLLSSVDGAGKSPVDSVVTYPLSAYAEAFRGLRTSVRYAVDGEPKVVMITSALPQEGKTTTSIALARSAALQGQKVVVIDCDVRRRSLTHLLRGMRPKCGLLEVLAGDGLLDDALGLDEKSGTYVLPLSGSGREIGELLSGAAMDSLLETLRQRFDLIVLDAAPVLPIAETRVLATKADAVVFVVRWRKTAEHAVRTALRLLPRPEVTIAGIALTRVDMRKQSRYGYGDPAYYYKQYKSYYA